MTLGSEAVQRLKLTGNCFKPANPFAPKVQRKRLKSPNRRKLWSVRPNRELERRWSTPCGVRRVILPTHGHSFETRLTFWLANLYLHFGRVRVPISGSLVRVRHLQHYCLTSIGAANLKAYRHGLVRKAARNRDGWNAPDVERRSIVNVNAIQPRG